MEGGGLKENRGNAHNAINAINAHNANNALKLWRNGLLDTRIDGAGPSDRRASSSQEGGIRCRWAAEESEVHPPSLRYGATRSLTSKVGRRAGRQRSCSLTWG